MVMGEKLDWGRDRVSQYDCSIFDCSAEDGAPVMPKQRSEPAKRKPAGDRNPVVAMLPVATELRSGAGWRVGTMAV